jgi:transposase-like protein
MVDIIFVFEKFPDENSCIQHLEELRWGGEPICPYCDSKRQTSISSELRYHCNNCNTSYSVTVGTIFHHTHLPLQKWFLAVCLILNVKKVLSVRQLARDLRVHPNTAWRIAKKIREGMSEQEQRSILFRLGEDDEIERFQADEVSGCRGNLLLKRDKNSYTPMMV